MDGQFRFKQLVSEMNKTVKKWTRPYSEPSVADIANTMSAWRSTLKHLEAYNDIQGPGLQACIRSIAKAWDVRDNRDASLKSLQAALEALKAIEDEELDKEKAFQPIDERKSAKALWGDLMAEYTQENIYLADEVYPIRRQLYGLQNAEVNDFTDSNLRSVKSEVALLADRYQTDSQLGSVIHGAVQELDRAIKYQNPNHRREAIKSAGQMIDMFAQKADNEHRPDGYKYEISNPSAIKEQVQKLSSMMYGYQFDTPINFLPVAISHIKSIHSYIGNFFDPKADRLARQAHEYLQGAYNVAKQPKVKSLQEQAWGTPQLQQNLDMALTKIDELNTYLSSNV